MSTLSDNYNGARQLTWTAFDLFGLGANAYDLSTDHLVGGGGTSVAASQYKAEQTGSLATDQHEFSEQFTITGSLAYETALFVGVRKHASDATWYDVWYFNNPGDGDGIVYIFKNVAGTTTLLVGPVHVTRWELDVPHTLKLRATGTASTLLEASIDGVAVSGGSYTDSSSPITGNLGVVHGGIELDGSVNVLLDNALGADIGTGEEHTGAALAYIGLQAKAAEQGVVALTGAATIRVAIGARVAGTGRQTPTSSALAYLGLRASVVGTKAERTRGARAYIGIAASGVGNLVQGQVATPPEPQHPVIWSPSPLYRFAAADIVSGVVRTLDLPLNDYVYTETLNRPGALRATIPLRSSYADENLLSAWNTAIYVIRDGKVEWGGILTPPTMQVGSDTLDIDCLGWLGYWDRRIIRADYAPMQVDQFNIFRHLVIEAQNESLHGDGYDLDIDVTFHNASGIGLSGVLRDRTDDYLASKAKNLGEALRELAAVDDGFDFAMQYAINTDTERIDKTIGLYYPHKGRTTGFVFEYETGMATNVTARGFADSVNFAWVGDGWGAGTDELRLSSPYVDETARGSYPPYDAAPSWSDVSVQETLDEHTAGYFDRTRRPKRTPVMRLDPTKSPMWGEYVIGDTVGVRISDGYGSTASVPEAHRITSTRVSEAGIDVVLDEVVA